MKFIVSSGALLKQLQLAGSVIQSNNSLPILDNFLFQLSGGVLKITASDLENVLTTSLLVESDSDGEACVPARILLDTLKTFPEQPLTFVFQGASGVEIASDYGKYGVNSFLADDFPRVAELEDSSSTQMPAHVLFSAIQKTLFAAGNDDLRPVMSGVFFQMSSEGSTFVATDAHKLVRYRRNDVQSSETAEFIMPKKPLTILKGVLPSAEDSVELHFNQLNARFSFGGFSLTCRLIDGRYPNYEAVIPRENPNRLRIGRAEFLGSVRRVSLFSNKTTHQVRLRMAGSEIQVSAEDLDFSNKAHERLHCDYAGQDLEIGFNSRFLTEMLSNLETESISMEFSQPNRAGLLSPEGGLDEGEEVLMLVMPVLINQA